MEQDPLMRIPNKIESYTENILFQEFIPFIADHQRTRNAMKAQGCSCTSALVQWPRLKAVSAGRAPPANLRASRLFHPPSSNAYLTPLSIALIDPASTSLTALYRYIPTEAPSNILCGVTSRQNEASRVGNECLVLVRSQALQTQISSQ